MRRLTSIHRCKYCEEPAKRNIVNGVNKGYLRTCGSQGCLNRQYIDKDVCAAKGRTRYKTEVTCEICNTTFIKGSPHHTRWCRGCVPSHKKEHTFKWRMIAARYGIGKPQWEALLERQGGTCALCKEPPKCVDHDHQTGKLRGLLCYRCNNLLSAFDTDTEWLVKAKNYVGSNRGEQDVTL